MFHLPEKPTRQEVLTFISESASYGNLGAFFGAGFSKAVLNDEFNEIALSWGALLEQASKRMNVDYDAIWKTGVGYPDIASVICKLHAENTGCDYAKSLSRLKREIAALTSWYPDKEKRETFSKYLECLSPSWIITTNYDLIGKDRRGVRLLRCRAAVSLILFLLMPLACADSYPAKPVRFIVAFPAGGNSDLVARIVGQKLTESLGRPFVIDNRGGAGGIIAEELAAKSAADGYTLLQVSIAHVVGSILNKKLSYDAMRDLTPVSLIVSAPNVLVVHKSLSVQSVPELIALAKAKPGQLSYASSHTTTLHLAGELFKAMAGVDIINVNYKSGGLAVPDLEAGRVQMAFSVITTALSALKGGRVRALAVTSAKRSPVLPDLPAIAEFVPGYELTGWQGILAPAGTPRAVVSKLGEELAKIMRMPDVRTKLVGMGVDPVGSTPEEFAKFRKAEVAKVSTLVSKAGITAEY